MLYSFSYDYGNQESNNAVDKFNNDFNRVYEKVSVVCHIKNHAGGGYVKDFCS